MHCGSRIAKRDCSQVSLLYEVDTEMNLMNMRKITSSYPKLMKSQSNMNLYGGFFNRGARRMPNRVFTLTSIGQVNEMNKGAFHQKL